MKKSKKASKALTGKVGVKKTMWQLPDGEKFGERLIKIILSLINSGMYTDKAINFPIIKGNGNDNDVERYAVSIFIKKVEPGKEVKKNGERIQLFL